MNNRIGIMEGRLSNPINNKIQAFPINSWRNEFKLAQKIGFEVVEWVFDSNEKNPIMDDVGISEIKQLSEQYGVLVNPVCADYFMHNLLFGVSEYKLEQNLKVLKTLIVKCNKLDSRILEIPFVDSSSIGTEEDKIQLLNNLEKVIQIAQENNIWIALETDLPPNDFVELLTKFNHPNILANYDVGNSAANQFDIKLELTLLKKWLVNIHVKDRIKNGITVPLGSGDVDFDIFFSTLKNIGYSGDLIIQGAREDLGISKTDPIFTCEKYFKFVKTHLENYNI